MFIRTALVIAALALPLGEQARGSAADVRAVTAARRAQNAAIVAHRVEEIASFWTDDVSLCRALGAQSAGKAAYRALFEADDPGAADTILYQREPLRVEVSGRWPLAFETGTWTGRRGGPAGEVIIRGRYSAQWVKRDARWLIRSEVFVALDGAGAGLALHAVP